jgi:hypothetical protein
MRLGSALECGNEGLVQLKSLSNTVAGNIRIILECLHA